MNAVVSRTDGLLAVPNTGTRSLDTLAYFALWGFVLVLPWSDSIPLLGQFVLGRWLGLLAALLGVLRFFVAGAGRRLSPVHLWMVAFVAWAGLSIVWTIDRDSTIVRLGTYAQLLVAAWLIWELAATETRVVRLLEAYAFGAGLGSISILQNYRSGRAAGDFTGGAGGSVWDQGRYTIAGFNANDLGLTLALSIPIIFYLLTRKKGIAWAALLWGLLSLVIAAILLTGSRGSLLAVGAGALMLPFMMARMPAAKRIVCVCLAIAVVTACVVLAPGGVGERYQGILAEMRGGTLTHRTLIWTAGLDVFRLHPLAGAGAGAYGAAVVRAIDVPYVAHNTFLSVLVELGIVGVLVLGGLLLTLIYYAVRMRSPEKYLWLAILLTWSVGVAALTWEYRKPTWFIFGALAAHACSRRTAAAIRPQVRLPEPHWTPAWQQDPRTVVNL